MYLTASPDQESANTYSQEAGARLDNSSSCLLAKSALEGQCFWSKASPGLIGFLHSHLVLSEPLLDASLRGVILAPHQLTLDSEAKDC